MHSFKDFEVTIEKRFESFEVLIRGDLLLAVVGRIHQMVDNLL
jgi:hypothetical protein